MIYLLVYQEIGTKLTQRNPIPASLCPFSSSGAFLTAIIKFLSKNNKEKSPCRKYFILDSRDISDSFYPGTGMCIIDQTIIANLARNRPIPPK